MELPVLLGRVLLCTHPVHPSFTLNPKLPILPSQGPASRSKAVAFNPEALL